MGGMDPAEIQAEDILRKLEIPSSGDGTYYLQSEYTEAVKYALMKT